MSAPPANAGALVGTRLGDYELVALLALGGTAEIYLARVGGHAGFEKYVVVKCLHDHLAYDPEFVQMFLDEARLGAQLDHSNIVQTLGLGEQDGRYYLVMEYVAGMSVALMARRAAERVRGARIPLPLVLGIGLQAAGGLHYAHERRQGTGQAAGSLNLVHRDISPQNLVVTFEGVVKIVDFGIAKAEERSTATRSGTIKGKFAYMSPEQCVAKNVDRRTDVFALGVVLHELLTGRRLFKRGSTYETYQAILECKVPLPSTINPEIDPALDAVIMTALAKDPDRRYPTSEAFGEAISHYLHRGGRYAGAGDISTFIEQFFVPEIADHGDRMRELIEGRGNGNGGWDDDEAEEISSEAIIEDEAPVGVTGFEDGPTGTTGEVNANDGSTRIEMNPLDRLAELNERVRVSAAFPVPEMPTTIAPSAQVSAQRALTTSPVGPKAAPLAPTPPAPLQPAPAAMGGVPAPARNPGPPRALFADAKPGGSMFGGAAKAGVSSFGGATKSTTPAAAASAPLKIASLFGTSAPVHSTSTPASKPAPPPPERSQNPPPIVPIERSKTQPPAPRGAAFGPSVVPTVIAEPEPTPNVYASTAAPNGATMSIDLLEVIDDLHKHGTNPGATQQAPAQQSIELSGGPMTPAGMGALAYGTPPGTPSSSDSMPYLDQTHLPAHLIGLPPSETYPHWDGTYPTPKRGLPSWVLPVLFITALGLATGLTVLIARVLG